ncbi:chromo shadow domain-containing protein [Purpureocillium lilacinum]|uniref:Chromo shadow domain-containing protein n=1 Tax=Purpureocillium lilacinum TaxID=33203 RepID=A0A179FFL7_PURLI|nr:chromo shadow domain-containing protein [Purpureocillium lilacinum]
MRTRSRAKVTKPVRSSTSRRQFLLAQETWEDLVAIDSMDTDSGGRLRVYIKTIDTGEVSAHDAAVTYAKCPQKVCVHAMSGTINSSADTRRCFASTRNITTDTCPECDSQTGVLTFTVIDATETCLQGSRGQFGCRNLCPLPDDRGVSLHLGQRLQLFAAHPQESSGSNFRPGCPPLLLWPRKLGSETRR